MSIDITSHTADGSALEDKNNKIAPILFDKTNDSFSGEYLDEVNRPHKESVVRIA